jgi:hypothetical protein
LAEAQDEGLARFLHPNLLSDLILRRFFMFPPAEVKDLMMLIMAGLLLLMAVISLFSGIITLVFRVNGKDIHTLASQTLRLAQKGVSDEVSGLVGNASALLEALNQLVKTTTGVGVFLILVSLLLFAGSYFMMGQM